ncbi:MAG: hypothetical protein F6J92_37530 [Symploca sp. SIO1A3]|nr:hypothetical protein [Symploca sp. SIO1A3]
MWGCEELRELRKLRKLRKLRELRELRKLEDKRELIAIGYKAQEIPPKISFTRVWGVGKKEELTSCTRQMFCGKSRQFA